MTTPPLSPAAQAIDRALADCIQLQGEIIRARPLAAAALIAAADQPYEVPAQYRGEDYWMYRRGVEAERGRNLAIAAELRQEGRA
jgi:hypothetical protein